METGRTRYVWPTIVILYGPHSAHDRAELLCAYHSVSQAAPRCIKNSYAFSQINKMRRRIEPNLVSGMRQYRGKKDGS